MSIFFSNADVDFTLPDVDRIKKWISVIVKNHGKSVGKINYLFCSDEYIYDANIHFLNHDTYTDIITFDYVEGVLLSGDILISVDRVGDNASKFSTSFERELRRVIIHGVLHLIGFKDKSEKDASVMRQKEEESLMIYDSLS